MPYMSHVIIFYALDSKSTYPHKAVCLNNDCYAQMYLVCRRPYLHDSTEFRYQIIIFSVLEKTASFTMTGMDYMHICMIKSIIVM